MKLGLNIAENQPTLRDVDQALRSLGFERIDQERAIMYAEDTVTLSFSYRR